MGGGSAAAVSEPPGGAGGAGATESQASMNLVNAIIGAGVLSLPSCYHECGLVLATGLVLAVSFLSTLSLQYLVQCAHRIGVKRYHELARDVIGERSKTVTEVSTFTLQLGALVAYVNILTDVLSPIANSVLPPSAEPSRTFIMFCVVFVGMLPVCLVTTKNVKILAYVSSLTIGIIAVFVSVVIDVAAVKLPKLGVGDIVLWDFDGVFTSLPVICFALTAHTALFVVMGSLNNPTVELKQRISVRAMTTVTFIYILVGSCGYLAFRDHTAGNVLRNFDGAFLGPVLSRVVKLGFGVTIIGTVPMVVQPLRDFLSIHLEGALALGSDERNAYKEFMPYVTTSASLILALLLAVYVPNVKTAFGLTGSTASMAMSFVLPGMIYLRSYGDGAQPTKLHGSAEKLADSEAGVDAPPTPKMGDAGALEYNGAGIGNGVDGMVLRCFTTLCSTKSVRRNINVSRFLIAGGLVFAFVSTASTLHDMVEEQKTVAIARTVAGLHKEEHEATEGIAEVSGAIESLDVAQEEFVRKGGATWVKDAQKDLERASGAAKRAADYAESAAAHHLHHKHNHTHGHAGGTSDQPKGEGDAKSDEPKRGDSPSSGDDPDEEKSDGGTDGESPERHGAAPKDLLERLSAVANVTQNSLVAMETAVQELIKANETATTGTALDPHAHLANVTAVKKAANTLYDAELQAQDAVQMLEDTKEYLEGEERVDSKVYARLVDESTFAVKAALVSLKEVGLGIEAVKTAAGNVTLAKIRAGAAVQAANNTAKLVPKQVHEDDTDEEKIEESAGKLNSTEIIKTANATVASLEERRTAAKEKAEQTIQSTHHKSRKRVTEIAAFLSKHTRRRRRR